MAANRYVALLRGINVGGRNPVPMAELQEAFTGAGLQDVSTYIQSGNVLFSTDRPAAGLEDHVEAVLEERFGVPIVVVVRSLRQLRSVVRSAPPGFGGQPDEHHSDVIFLKRPLTAAKAMEVVRLRDGVDRAWAGTGVLYFARLSERRTQSRLSSIMGTPEYRLMTIRNWRTTTTLLELLGAPVRPG
jgi:uncharacterized protein (DUF1697 family)